MNGPTGSGFATYTPDNVFVKNGYLSFKMNYLNQKYTTGGVLTYRKFSQMYGYFEMRARLPKGLGLWNAFYLMPQDGSWPPEIDILEMNGKWPDTVRMSTRWGTDANRLSRGVPYTGPDFSQDFHTFAIEWQKGKIRWFVDNVQRYETESDVPVPDKPFYMNINTAIGIAQWAGYPDQTTIFPQYYDIDYVRVYEKAS
jgi:beta-glucanase (GH16 family)